MHKAHECIKTQSEVHCVPCLFLCLWLLWQGEQASLQFLTGHFSVH